jgi:folate-binding protein YgfZ
MLISPLREVQVNYASRPPAAQDDAHLIADRPGAASGTRVAASIEFIPYALASGGEMGVESGSGPACELVGTLGEVEAEYAAIRRGAGIFDAPHRATILVTGSPGDRRDFLNRMVTQELKDLAPGMVREAFWLNRKGRIDADLMLIELGERMLIDVDIHQAAHTVTTLGDFIFSEDVQLADVTAHWHHIAVHGPLALDVVAAASGQNVQAPRILEPLRAIQVEIDGANVVVTRRDQAGEIGLEIIAPRDRAVSVWRRFVETDTAIAGGRRRVRPIGWHAFNIARIEAGTPLFNIDFGANNLPHESGILHRRVSFTKGCYLGQEVVARMESRGHSKSNLVGLRIADDALPVAGAQIFDAIRPTRNVENPSAIKANAPDDSTSQARMGESVGVVTSSTLSPMLGAAPIAFGMIRASHAQAGSIVLVNAEGAQSQAAVTSLEFWRRAEPAGRGGGAMQDHGVR